MISINTQEKISETLKEIDQYLSENPKNYIGSGSILHNKVKDLLDDMNDVAEHHTEIITCPECMRTQPAKVLHTVPFYSYIHKCDCGHMIMESEWNKVPANSFSFQVFNNPLPADPESMKGILKFKCE